MIDIVLRCCHPTVNCVDSSPQWERLVGAVIGRPIIKYQGLKHISRVFQ